MRVLVAIACAGCLPEPMASPSPSTDAGVADAGVAEDTGPRWAPAQYTIVKIGEDGESTRLLGLSADGRKVLAVGGHRERAGDGVLRLYDRKGGEPLVLAEQFHFSGRHAVLSADGRVVAWREARPPATTWTRVIGEAPKEWPNRAGTALSADGSQLYFVRGVELYALTLATEHERFVAAVDASCLHVDGDVVVNTTKEEIAIIAEGARVRVAANAPDSRYAMVCGARSAAAGTRVYFHSIDALDPADENGLADIYVWHRATGLVSWVSRRFGADYGGTLFDVSADGRDIVYANLVGGMNMRDMETGEAFRVASSEMPMMSANGCVFGFDRADDAVQPLELYVSRAPACPR